MKKLYKKLLIKFLDSKLFQWIAIAILPYIRFTTYYTSTRGDIYHAGYIPFRKGHIIGAIDTKKLTGAFIPQVTGGKLCHSALAVGKRDPRTPFSLYSKILPEPKHGQGLEVVEMTHLNFTHSDFYDICKESERIILFRCTDWDDEYTELVINAALDLREAIYDAAFKLGIKSLYCSELVYQADRLANYRRMSGDYKAMEIPENIKVEPRLKCNLEDLAGLGRPYISPDGLLCSKNVVVDWDSAHEFTGLTGPDIEKIIFNKGK